MPGFAPLVGPGAPSTAQTASGGQTVAPPVESIGIAFSSHSQSRVGVRAAEASPGPTSPIPPSAPTDPARSSSGGGVGSRTGGEHGAMMGAADVRPLPHGPLDPQGRLLCQRRAALRRQLRPLEGGLRGHWLGAGVCCGGRLLPRRGCDAQRPRRLGVLRPAHRRGRRRGHAHALLLRSGRRRRPAGDAPRALRHLQVAGIGAARRRGVGGHEEPLTVCSTVESSGGPEESP